MGKRNLYLDTKNVDEALSLYLEELIRIIISSLFAISLITPS